MLKADLLCHTNLHVTPLPEAPASFMKLLRPTKKTTSYQLGHDDQRRPREGQSIAMSSTVVKGSSTQVADTKFPASILPVPVLDTPLSRVISFARPGLILSMLALRFNSLVYDPVATLKSALPALALLQVVYAVFCLPVAGSQTAKTPRKARPGEKKKADSSSPNPVSVRLYYLLFLMKT